MQRLIKFSKFRNIGLEKDEYLLLNPCFKKGYMGNLVILIGPNNSGKSNVLEGIVEVCNSDKLGEKDVTNLYYEDEYRHPSISLIYKDDKNEVVLEKTRNNNSVGWKSVSMEGEVIKKPNTESIKKDAQIIRAQLNSVSYFPPFASGFFNIIFAEDSTDEDVYNAALGLINGIHNHMGRVGYSQSWNNLEAMNIDLINHWKSLKGFEVNKAQAFISNTIGIDPNPRAIIYKERPLSSSDLYVDSVNQLENNRFFASLLKSLSINSKDIKNAYDDFNNTGNKAVLNKLNKKVHPKIEKLNTQFNKLYFVSDDKYKFTLDFESSRISFGMARGKEEDPIRLEYQSTGFKWFFNLFFNFLSTNDLRPGDIVIMDEPATNLHPQGQQELRSFIKQFGIENDVLFVIATHSPFLLDVDHYDELRVISMNNNRSKVDNRFSAINDDDPDSLLPIKESLTIKQNVLYDLDTEVVWVEGITDYNYLTMFKNLLGINNLAFLPFNGVGNNTKQTTEILKKLLKVKFHKVSLLVDADRAGKDMYAQAKEAAFDEVYSMSQVKIGENKNAMMVEDLFSREDKNKFTAINAKNGNGTSVMKDHCKLSDFTQQTIDNFKQLFDIILNS